MYVDFGAIGRLKKYILNTAGKNKDYFSHYTYVTSDYFYNHRIIYCRSILIEEYLSNLAETLSVEVKKPIKDRKPLENLINKFLTDTPKELIPEEDLYSYYDVRKHLNNWLSKYKTKSLSLNDEVLNDKVPNYLHLNRIHQLMYSYMFPISSEVKECLSNLIETLSVEVKKSIKSRKPLKKLIDKFLKDTSKEVIQDNMRKCLKDWLSKYNNKSLSIDDKIPSLYKGQIPDELLSSDLKKQLKKTHDLMYSYLLPPAFDARKIGKAKTTEDIDAKTKNK